MHTCELEFDVVEELDLERERGVRDELVKVSFELVEACDWDVVHFAVAEAQVLETASYRFE